MTAEQYIRKINDQVQSLFTDSLSRNREILNTGIDTSKSIQTWYAVIPDEKYKILISNGIQALEISLLSQSYCLYRNAFSALRLSMEMIFGGVYFSTNLLDFVEWTKSSKDLNWSTINDEQNGVLSHRFINAFFPELDGNYQTYYTKSKELYRNLSEYVHGNHHTWITGKEALKIDEGEINLYHHCLEAYSEIIFFILSMRYLKSFEVEKLSEVESIIQTMYHIKPIHSYLTNSNNA